MGRPLFLPAPGVLDFDEKLVQLREKPALCVQPITVVHKENVEEASISEPQSCVQTRGFGDVIVLEVAENLEIWGEKQIDPASSQLDIHISLMEFTPASFSFKTEVQSVGGSPCQLDLQLVHGSVILRAEPPADFCCHPPFAG